MNTRTVTRGWKILFAAWTLQGCLALLLLVSLPSDSNSGMPFGFSAARWALILAAALFTLASGWLGRQSFKPTWTDTAAWLVLKDAVLMGAIGVVVLAQASLAILQGLSQEGLIYHYAAYASRLAPLFNLLSLSAFELIAWFVWLRRERLKNARPLLTTAAWIWLGLGALLALVALTRIGVDFERIGVFSKPTTPFWEWQIVLAWAAGSAALLAGLSGNFPRFRHPDLWIGLALWAGVSTLWLSQPVNVAWQAGPRAPNFEFYPFSDALYYDQYAQSILIGNGIFGDAIPSRPLYVGFLALLHALAGQDYHRVIALQSLILACFPVSLYFIGREIAGRPLGLMLAILTALRDVTTNLAADYAGNFSYSKFYLSELPTALLLSLFTLFLLMGARRPALWNVHILLAGGMMGLAVLMRTQSLFVLPPAMLLAYLGNRAGWKDWIKAGTTLALTIALTISPWLWRNWVNTGGILMDDPGSQMSLRALWYHGEEDAIVARLPGENDSRYSSRLVGIALAGIRENPGANARLILAHFLNSQIGNLLVFPVRESLESTEELWRPTRAFWEHVELDFPPSQTALLAGYLLVFSLGAAAAWRGAGYFGLIPLGINLAYNLSTALFLSSGMRFLLTADWGFYLYYALGLLALSYAVLSLLDRTHALIPASWPARAPVPVESSAGTLSRTRVLAGGLIFFLVSASLPLSERLVPDRYAPASREALAQQLVDAAPVLIRESLAQQLENPEYVLLQGRALYPRYYAAEEGEPGTGKLGYAPMPQARLVFFLIGDANSSVIFDLPESPGFFPHAADVVLAVRREPDHLQAVVVLVQKDGTSALYRSPGP